MNIYDTDTQMLTCTCEDWTEVRSGYAMDNPRRLCKHIINKLDTDNLSKTLNYFREDIEFYQSKEKGFGKEFQKIIPLLDSKYIALYNDNDWTNIYNEDGESFALIITSFNNDFKWANDKKPKDFQEIEIYFDTVRDLQVMLDTEDEILKSEISTSNLKTLDEKPVCRERTNDI